MKILIVANEYFNLFNFRMILINKILKNFPKTKLILLAKYDGFQKKIDEKNLLKFDLNFKSRSLNPFNAFFIIYKLNKFFRVTEIKVIMSYTFKCNFFNCLLNIFYKKNLIVNVTGMGEMYLSKNILKKFIFNIYCLLLSKANFIICQNIDDKNFLISKNYKLKNKLLLIPGSGIDLNFFNFQKIDFTRKINFLIVARIIKEKGILEFIDAAKSFIKKYPDKATFTIIGNTYNDKFKRLFLAKIRDSQIKYLSFSHSIKNEISKSTCCVLPSYREGLSRFLLESLALGRPIIASNVPGCRDLVKDNYNGFLLNDINSTQLLILFERFIKLSNKKIREYSNFSRKFSYQFDEKIINKEIINIFRSIL